IGDLNIRRLPRQTRLIEQANRSAGPGYGLQHGSNVTESPPRPRHTRDSDPAWRAGHTHRSDTIPAAPGGVGSTASEPASPSARRRSASAATNTEGTRFARS